jgi:DNA-binding protein Fis
LPPATITPQALERLSAQPWPGNIRQLKQTLERTLLLVGRSELRQADFVALEQHEHGSPRLGVDGMTLEQVERHMIVHALEQHQGNISRVAKTLGLSRTALYRRLERHGLGRRRTAPTARQPRPRRRRRAHGRPSPSLRQRLYAYLIAAHALFFALTVLLLRGQPVLMLALEAALLLSLALGLRLVRRALEPLGYTRHFHDLLQDQHYAARLQHSSDKELNELVQLFNTMLGALYQERLQIGEQQGFLDRLLEATPSAVIVFDFDGRISLLNASAHALPGLADARGKTLAECASAGDSLLTQLDALPLGDSQLLADAEGRRYRGQRGQFYDRGFARHFLLVEELTEELELGTRHLRKADPRARARSQQHGGRHRLGARLAAVLPQPAGRARQRRLQHRHPRRAAPQRQPGRVHRALHARGEDAGAGAAPAAIRDIMDDILYLYREQCRSRGISIAWQRCDEVRRSPWTAS